MTRKSDYAFWTFVMLACLAGATTVLNVTRTYSATSTNSEIYKQLDLFGDVLERVRTDYVDKPDDAMLIDSAINGMLAALDPHSAYLNPKNYRDMQVQTRGEFGGLGIEVTMEKAASSRSSRRSTIRPRPRPACRPTTSSRISTASRSSA